MLMRRKAATVTDVQQCTHLLCKRTCHLNETCRPHENKDRTNLYLHKNKDRTSIYLHENKDGTNIHLHENKDRTNRCLHKNKDKTNIYLHSSHRKFNLGSLSSQPSSAISHCYQTWRSFETVLNPATNGTNHNVDLTSF